MEREELIMYLAAVREAVSAVLMREREAKQMPVYFVSRALQGSKINYTSIEKLVLALVHARKRLKRYFQDHTIIVITDQPIKQILSRPQVAGRLQKWSIKLGEYDIQYGPRTSVKGQILADFIVECPEDDPLDTPMEAEEELPDPWRCSRTDHLANQVNGSYIAKEPGMIQYLEKVKTLSSSFKKLSIKQVLVEELKEKSINEVELLAVVEEEGDTWMTRIYNYLMKETLPAEMEKARAVRRKSGRQRIVSMRPLNAIFRVEGGPRGGHPKEETKRTHGVSSLHLMDCSMNVQVPCQIAHCACSPGLAFVGACTWKLIPKRTVTGP
ncbi:reverse transcriptase domain-containing protein [Tanacetum coccineum]